MAIRDLVRRGSRHPARTTHTNPFTALQREMNRLFEDFWSGSEGSYMERLPEYMGGIYGPNIDVTEDRETVEVTAELPGMTDKDIQVHLAPSRDYVTIRGEKRDERQERERGYTRSERYFGSFRRDVPLPTTVRDENIDANFKNGVLNLRFMKSEEGPAGSKRINVRGS
jgi:HSP20 family protein